MNTLEVKGLEKKYKDFALQNITLELPKGFICGYVGQNGAGKTTTLDLITHQKKADAGVVRIDGMEYEENPKKYKEMIGYVCDKCYFPNDFTLLDVKGILKDFYETFQEDKFMNLCKKWDLPEKKKVKDYSRGMTIRLMFAGILARDTKLLILDEATNGLDPVVKQEILEILQDYIQDGERSVLFSTHILSDLEEIADYIFFLHNGKEVFFDTKEEIAEKYLLVKGGLDELTEAVSRKIKGLKKTSVGFEGIIETDDSVCVSRKCVLEKPTINQIVISYIKDMEG
ncbi:MAG: ABC transporter ATP-binding protein [Lachnospiraceae bacterium]|nr:ABC transporter ATP-binding protein [Lachnospiraceae bacterium]